MKKGNIRYIILIIIILIVHFILYPQTRGFSQYMIPMITDNSLQFDTTPDVTINQSFYYASQPQIPYGSYITQGLYGNIPSMNPIFSPIQPYGMFSMNEVPFFSPNMTFGFSMFLPNMGSIPSGLILSSSQWALPLGVSSNYLFSDFPFFVNSHGANSGYGGASFYPYTFVDKTPFPSSPSNISVDWYKNSGPFIYNYGLYGDMLIINPGWPYIYYYPLYHPPPDRPPPDLPPPYPPTDDPDKFQSYNLCQDMEEINNSPHELELKYLPGLGFLDGITSECSPEEKNLDSSLHLSTSLSDHNNLKELSEYIQSHISSEMLSQADFIGSRHSLILARAYEDGGTREFIVAIDPCTLKGYAIEHCYLCDTQDLQLGLCNTIYARLDPGLLEQLGLSPSANNVLYEILYRENLRDFSYYNDYPRVVLLVAPKIIISLPDNARVSSHLVIVGEEIEGIHPETGGGVDLTVKAHYPGKDYPRFMEKYSYSDFTIGQWPELLQELHRPIPSLVALACKTCSGINRIAAEYDFFINQFAFKMPTKEDTYHYKYYPGATHLFCIGISDSFLVYDDVLSRSPFQELGCPTVSWDIPFEEKSEVATINKALTIPFSHFVHRSPAYTVTKLTSDDDIIKYVEEAVDKYLTRCLPYKLPCFTKANLEDYTPESAFFQIYPYERLNFRFPDPSKLYPSLPGGIATITCRDNSCSDIETEAKPLPPLGYVAYENYYKYFNKDIRFIQEILEEHFRWISTYTEEISCLTIDCGKRCENQPINPFPYLNDIEVSGALCDKLKQAGIDKFCSYPLSYFKCFYWDENPPTGGHNPRPEGCDKCLIASNQYFHIPIKICYKPLTIALCFECSSNLLQNFRNGSSSYRHLKSEASKSPHYEFIEYWDGENSICFSFKGDEQDLWPEKAQLASHLVEEFWKYWLNSLTVERKIAPDGFTININNNKSIHTNQMILSAGGFFEEMYRFVEEVSLREGSFSHQWTNVYRILTDFADSSWEGSNYTVSGNDYERMFGIDPDMVEIARKRAQSLKFSDQEIKINSLGLTYGPLEPARYEIIEDSAVKVFFTLQDLRDDWQDTSLKIRNLVDEIDYSGDSFAWGNFFDKLGSLSGQAESSFEKIRDAHSKMIKNKTLLLENLEDVIKDIIKNTNQLKYQIELIWGCNFSDTQNPCDELTLLSKINALEDDCGSDLDFFGWFGDIIEYIPYLGTASKAIKEIGKTLEASKEFVDDWKKISEKVSDITKYTKTGFESIGKFCNYLESGASRDTIEELLTTEGCDGQELIELQGLKTTVSILFSQLRDLYGQAEYLSLMVANEVNELDFHTILCLENENMASALRDFNGDLEVIMRDLPSGSIYGENYSVYRMGAVNMCKAGQLITRLRLKEAYRASQLLQMMTGATATDPYIHIPCRYDYIEKYSHGFWVSIWDKDRYEYELIMPPEEEESTSYGLLGRLKYRYYVLLKDQIFNPGDSLNPEGSHVFKHGGSHIFTIRKTIQGEEMADFLEKGSLIFEVGLDELIDSLILFDEGQIEFDFLAFPEYCLILQCSQTDDYVSTNQNNSEETYIFSPPIILTSPVYRGYSDPCPLEDAIYDGCPEPVGLPRLSISPANYLYVPTTSCTSDDVEWRYSNRRYNCCKLKSCLKGIYYEDLQLELSQGEGRDASFVNRILTDNALENVSSIEFRYPLGMQVLGRWEIWGDQGDLDKLRGKNLSQIDIVFVVGVEQTGCSSSLLRDREICDVSNPYDFIVNWE